MVPLKIWKELQKANTITMGIRIQKVLGYGLSNVIANKDRWDYGDDPRFNKDSYLFDEFDGGYSVEGFKQHLLECVYAIGDEDLKRFELRMLIRDLEDPDKKFTFDLYDSIKRDMEMGLDNVICFVPPSQFRAWVRHDDIIDYCDPSNRSDDGGIKENLILLDNAIYPYVSYINIKEMPPTTLTGTQMQHYYSLKNNGFDKLVETETVFKSLGVENKKELETMLVPLIPAELVELLKYLEIFVDESCIYQLRPMIYSWWG